MKLRTICLLGVILLASVSCEQILEETPKSFFEEGNAFQTGKDATSAINGVYNRLRSVYNMSWFHLSDVSGEELEANPVLAEARDIDLNRYTSGTTIFDGFYTNSYILIDRANRVIANVPAIAMDAKLRDQIVGEARFLRALVYFNLVRTFGDVPLVTSPTTDVTNVQRPRDETEKVYQQVIQDLKEAEAVLPAKYTVVAEIGRATSGAAKAMLAKVYLTRKDWTNAAAKAKEVIDSKAYSLVPNYKDIFPPEKKNGPEHIFSVQFSCVLNTYGSPMAEAFAMVFTYPVQQAGGFLYVTPYHIKTYLPGDARQEINVVTEKKNIATGAIIKPGADQGPANDKYWDSAPCGRSQARNNFMVIRYADVLLMYAEALNELNGPGTDAYAAINQIRARARNGVATAEPQDLKGLTQAQFRDAVLQERSWELCFEGHRRWDLLRTGKFLETLQKAGIPVAEKNLLYPIPQNEIDVNPALKQNPGY
ncbi:RagB/SusD family nutrient uptake outer membrane protein [Larkinella rosea]|uniref:RagB/SusD family nutrient uptake outer membrane protein n=1 Tax=Larkinella rosea TaxID=2025312 RepID=A0A3P1BRF8_9BACT|nr:RagB/SusD family nutrient uptake outer membrane protein [Larkinella rosea]RRB03687.1 RagB/SusD family nutrient uptake outer membrane protein [Larkinella rosea]